jgi:hypothetical protein
MLLCTCYKEIVELHLSFVMDLQTLVSRGVHSIVTMKQNALWKKWGAKIMRKMTKAWEAENVGERKRRGRSVSWPLGG